MKKIALLAFLISLPFFANCQVDSVLYGLASNVNSYFLARVNPSTGLITNISLSSISNGYQSPNATIAPFHKIYYFVNPVGNIVGLSLVTGAIVSSQKMTNSNGTTFVQLLFNCSDSTIYGLASNANSYFLAKVNPSTGLITNISTSSISNGYQSPNATIDPFNKIYYFVNPVGDIVGLSLINGEIVSSQKMTNSNGTTFVQLLFNCSDSTIYGLASNANSYFLAKVNPSTGLISNISTSSISNGYQSPNATIDPFNKIYYFVNPVGDIVGLSLVTGKIVSSQQMTNTNGTTIVQLLFNSNYCTSISTGVENTNKLRLNIYPNPASNILFIDNMQEDNYILELINSCGQIELTNQIRSSSKTELNLSKIKNGIYLLKVMNSEYSEMRKIIISNVTG